MVEAWRETDPPDARREEDDSFHNRDSNSGAVSALNASRRRITPDALVAAKALNQAQMP